MRFNQRIQALPVLIGLGAFLATGCGGSQDEHAGHDHGTDTEVVVTRCSCSSFMVVESNANLTQFGPFQYHFTSGFDDSVSLKPRIRFQPFPIDDPIIGANRHRPVGPYPV